MRKRPCRSAQPGAPVPANRHHSRPRAFACDGCSVLAGTCQSRRRCRARAIVHSRTSGASGGRNVPDGIRLPVTHARVSWRSATTSGERRLDASYYDLLASEARLCSFVAIAQGQLPQESWFALGRLLTTYGGEPAAAVLERLDVRIPDAAAGDADATRTRCSTRPTGPRSSGRSNTASSAACRGAFPNPATTPSTCS